MGDKPGNASISSASTTARLKIKDFYDGKHILITGCSGFLGKVLLYKIVKSCPSIHRIYLLLPFQLKSSKHERLQTIINSRCFDGLKKEMGEEQFMDFVMDKFVPLNGDLIHEGLDLSPEDRDLIVDNVQIIINNATSQVYQVKPLLESLKFNYFGNMRMLDLAK